MEEVLGRRDTCWVSRKERQGWLVGSDLVHSWFLLSLVLGSSLRPQSLRRSACSEQGLEQVCLHHSEPIKETGLLSSPLLSIPPVKQQSSRRLGRPVVLQQTVCSPWSPLVSYKIKLQDFKREKQDKWQLKAGFPRHQP